MKFKNVVFTGSGPATTVISFSSSRVSGPPKPSTSRILGSCVVKVKGEEEKCPVPTTLAPSVSDCIPHLRQAGITTCPCVPDGADVQCVHLLGKPEPRFVSKKYEGSSHSRWGMPTPWLGLTPRTRAGVTPRGLGLSQQHQHRSHHVGSCPVQEEAIGVHSQGHQVPTGGLLRAVQDKGQGSESWTYGSRFLPVS